jgi:Right handed beta helix region
LRLVVPICFASLAAVAACGGGSGSPSGSTGAAGGGGGSACAKGEVEGGAGKCLAVGIAGCADAFVEDDGVCRPALAKCKQGEIPDFARGCTAIGISKCHPKFVGADGLCHPTMSACPKGTYAVPEKGCVSIDGDEGCGAAPWGGIKDAPNTFYVDPTYAGGDGDGSKAKPLPTLVAAYGLAPSGGRIVLAAGHYPEALHVTKSIDIEGRCPSLVTIDGNDGSTSTPTVLFFEVGTSALRGVRLSGDGVGVYARGTLTVDRVHIDGTLGDAITTDQPATLTVTRTLIESVRPTPGIGGDAVGLWSGVHATIDASAIVGSPDYAVTTSDLGTSLVMTDSLIEGTLGDASGGLGPGLVTAASSTAKLSSVALMKNHDIGAQAGGDSSLTLTNCVVEGTLSRGSDQLHGVGVEVIERSNASVDLSAILANHAAGVLTGDSGTKLTITRTLVADTEVQPGDQGVGFGIQVGGGSEVTVSDATFARNHTMGMVVTDVGTKLTVTRVLVEATAPRPDGQYGLGVASLDGGILTWNDGAVVGCKVAGFFLAKGTGHIGGSLVSRIEGGDFTLQNPPQKLTGVGDGALATRGGDLEMTAARVEGCARAGILYDSSLGSVVGSASTSNQYGVVVDGSPTPTIDGASAFAGNAKAATVNDAKLPVPNEPATLP